MRRVFIRRNKTELKLYTLFLLLWFPSVPSEFLQKTAGLQSVSCLSIPLDRASVGLSDSSWAELISCSHLYQTQKTPRWNLVHRLAVVMWRLSFKPEHKLISCKQDKNFLWSVQLLLPDKFSLILLHLFPLWRQLTSQTQTSPEFLTATFVN